MDFLTALPIIRTVWNWVKTRIGLNRTHDVAVFTKLNNMLDESSFDNILNHSLYNGYLRTEENTRLQNFVEALRRIENRYLEAVVQLRAETLAWEMDQLLDIVVQSFFHVRETEILKFYPEQIESAVYDAQRKELNLKCVKAWEAYKTYRTAVKDRLTV